MPRASTETREVEVIGRDDAYRGYFRIENWRVRHSLFRGGWSGEIKRELFERGHAAAVLLYDPARDQVALIEQFRVGALAAGLHPWLIEVVAGIIEDGETPEDVARREAQEESGAAVDDMLPIGRFLASPGGTSETTALFCARVDCQGLGGIHGLAEEGEDIRALVVGADEALTMVEDGRINNATTIIAVQWLALHKRELQNRWGVANN